MEGGERREFKLVRGRRKEGAYGSHAPETE
jgi:hypothetical protein